MDTLFKAANLRARVAVRNRVATRSRRRVRASREIKIQIAVSTLKAFWAEHAEHLDAEGPTLSWYRAVLKADWAQPADVKAQFGTASVLGDGRVVFNIAGNKYRIVVWINYPYRIVYVRFIGTHRQYDQIDAQSN